MAEMQRENAGEKKHTLTLTARAHAELAGVVEVKSFDEDTVVLDTVCGEMTVEGEGLRVGTLDMTRGVLVIDGRVHALYYTDTKETRKKGLFRGALR